MSLSPEEWKSRLEAQLSKSAKAYLGSFLNTDNINAMQHAVKEELRAALPTNSVGYSVSSIVPDKSNRSMSVDITVSQYPFKLINDYYSARQWSYDIQKERFPQFIQLNHESLYHIYDYVCRQSIDTGIFCLIHKEGKSFNCELRKNSSLKEWCNLNTTRIGSPDYWEFVIGLPSQSFDLNECSNTICFLIDNIKGLIKSDTVATTLRESTNNSYHIQIN